MNWLNDVGKVVQNVVTNPVPAVVGGALAGTVGTVVGAGVAHLEVEGNKQLEAELKEYRDRINKAIDEVKAAPKNYAELEKIWIQIMTEGFLAAWKEQYGDATPPPEVLAPMIAVDLDKRRKSLSPEQFTTELDNIHNGTVQASVQQLEHERDNPDKKSEPTTSEAANKFFSEFFDTTLKWLAGRFQSNFEGAQNESGFGAKLLRGGVGISWEDIKSRGLLGGDNSYLRKIIPTWNDNGGLFGGENSFFRKPFG